MNNKERRVGMWLCDDVCGVRCVWESAAAVDRWLTGRLRNPPPGSSASAPPAGESTSSSAQSLRTSTYYILYILLLLLVLLTSISLCLIRHCFLYNRPIVLKESYSLSPAQHYSRFLQFLGFAVVELHSGLRESSGILISKVEIPPRVLAYHILIQPFSNFDGLHSFNVVAARVTSLHVCFRGFSIQLTNKNTVYAVTILTTFLAHFLCRLHLIVPYCGLLAPALASVYQDMFTTL